MYSDMHDNRLISRRHNKTAACHASCASGTMDTFLHLLGEEGGEVGEDEAARGRWHGLECRERRRDVGLDTDLLPHLVAVIYNDLHRAVDLFGTLGAGRIADAHHRRTERLELVHELVESSELLLA